MRTNFLILTVVAIANLCSINTANAQDEVATTNLAVDSLTYISVDSTSWALYQLEEWNDLRKFGALAEEGGFETYFLNLRLGIANFKTGHFHKAEAFLLKAYDQNPAALTAKEYLFWIYSLSGNVNAASDMYDMLSEELKSEIDFDLSQGLKSVYAEAGPMLSDNEDVAGTSLYGNVGARYRLNDKLSIYSSYTYLENGNMSWGGYSQHQLSVTPTLLLDNGWLLSAGLNYFNYSRDIYQSLDQTITSSFQYTEEGIWFDEATGTEYTWETPETITSTVVYNDTYEGTLSENSVGINLNATKTFRDFSISPHAVFYGEFLNTNYVKTNSDIYDVNTSWDYTDYFFTGFYVSTDSTPGSVDTTYTLTTTEQYDTSMFIYYMQVGTSFDYTYRLNESTSLTLGAEVTALINGDSLQDISNSMKFIYTPYLAIKAGDKFGISAYYTSKGNYPVSMFGGSKMLNGYDAINSRISVTAKYDLNDRFSIYATGMMDEIEDGVSLSTYNNYAILTGLNIKL
jgi:tetratricopeptide (TPR) repeat protein